MYHKTTEFYEKRERIRTRWTGEGLTGSLRSNLQRRILSGREWWTTLYPGQDDECILDRKRRGSIDNSTKRQNLYILEKQIKILERTTESMTDVRVPCIIRHFLYII